MSEQLKHIFDLSACPTKRQMKDYLNGTMEGEEIYAFEHHINSCFLCSEALDGMMEQAEEAVAGVEQLNNEFLKDHLELHPPQIHLNSMAPAPSLTPTHHRGKANSQRIFWKPVGIAAALVICLGLGWYFKNTPSQITQQSPSIAQANRNEMVKENPSSEVQPLSARMETAGAYDNLAETSQTHPSVKRAGKEIAAITEPKTTEQTQPAPGALPEEVAVKEYKLPLANKTEPPANTPVTAVQTSQVATKNTADVTSLSAATYQQKSNNALNLGGGRTSGELYVIDGAQVKGGENERSKKADKERRTMADDNADDLYNDGKYAKALTAYKKQINSSGGKESQQAKLMAARCYLQLGQKSNAEKLLKELAETGNGASKRQARRILRDMDRNAASEEE
ncbi:MAG TPA: tetratricopeptide repeat protein [Flavipsychrobacter sp.]|nr:tetratricopeptide repeat protein [Flavipsychrobacter sp.]